MSSSKGKPFEERASNTPSKSASGKQARYQRGRRRRRSRSRLEPKADPDYPDDKCYYCGETGYWKPEYPYRDDPSFTPINSV